MAEEHDPICSCPVHGPCDDQLLLGELHSPETVSELWLQPAALPAWFFLPFLISHVLDLSASLKSLNAYLCSLQLYTSQVLSPILP